MQWKPTVVAFACGAMLLSAQADNTKKNKGDRSEAAMTADKQGQTEEDREISRKIRKSLMDDKSLSTYAKNVKIITKAGKVTLKGPVNSEEEKQKIENFATSVAGAANVTNSLEIVKKGKDS